MASRSTRSRYKAEPGGFSRVSTEMQKSEAFQSLSGKALRVLLYALFLNYNSATQGAGQPVFKFTNAMARDILGMHQATFSRAKDELGEKGFIKWERRGGLKGVNGVPSEFSLSGDWKRWSKKQRSSHPIATGSSHPIATGRHEKKAENKESSHPIATGSDSKAVTPLRHS